MIILHAALLEDSLALWAESSKEDRAGANVQAIAAELGVPLTTKKRATRKVAAWLPSTRKGPVPSDAMLDDEPSPAEAVRIAPWTITALRLDAGAAISLLAGCAGKRLLRPGLLAGADVAYWTAALRFAAGLVMRGQYLPGIVCDQGAFRARSQPVISGPDIARVQALAQAMPPAARALATDAGDAPPQVPARTVLRRFLEFAVDGLVRSATSADPHAPIESIHDQWIRGLTGSDSLMHGSGGDLAILAAQVQQWQRPIQISADSPFRLCFRLEEPATESEPWLIRYLLQGNRDPSLLLPAADAWDLKRRAASALGNDGAAIREHLLSSLGQASAIYPPIETSLRQRAPESCALDVVGAHGFLRETAAALEQSGFGVMLPAWWTSKGSRTHFKARAHVKSSAPQGGLGLSMESIVQFDWKLALGGENISYDDLRALAKLKAPLVKLRGQWVEVDSAAIQAALDFLKSKSSGATTLGEIVRVALGATAAAGPVEIDGVTASGWVGDLLAQLEGNAPFAELPQPPELHGTLRPYQRRGYSWMEFLKQWGLGACLADDMGLGKTIQALAVIQKEYAQNGQRPVLLICPMSVVGNWQKEAARFAPDLPVLVHHGARRHKGEAFAREAARHAIVLSSYALLHRDIEALSGIEWRGIILDEAQNIKNPETKQARAARALRTDWRIALTGTPIENHVGDLWSLMEFLNPGFLGSQSNFKTRFMLPIQVYGDAGASERLRRVTGPFILRRLKTDRSIITDLPEKLEMKVFCTLTKEQASLYAAVVKDAEKALEASEGIERKGIVLATLSKLKQVCNHPAQFLRDNSAIPGRSGKLARLAEMIEETLEVGDRSLIFTQFTEMGELIRRHLQESFGSEVLYLHGGTPKKQRDQMVERFGSEDGPRLFLLSLKAGGTGLNLTSANHVFHFDRWWNPAVENQATDRAFRIGQMKNVQVHKFVCAGTLEEKIDEMIERKKDIAGRVVGTGEAWLTELSNAELRNLFSLRQEAVGE